MLAGIPYAVVIARAAISRKYFRANTDRILYDTEEFAQAFE